MSVWTHAVVLPAARRAAPVWVGAGIVGAVVFGGTGMQPRDLTGLARHAAGVAAVLGATWLLVMLPAARVLVRAEGARFLRSLPGPRVAPVGAAAGALVVLQGPWVALWLAGEGAAGALVVVGGTIVLAVLARWQRRPPRARELRWRGAASALAGVYARALARRASDALVRGLGLAVLAGIAAGLVVRNNALAGGHAAVLGAAVIAVVLVPGALGALAPLAEAHRATAWLAATLGIPEALRELVLAASVTAVYAAGALVAALSTGLLVGPATAGVLVPAALGAGIASSLLATRAVLATAEAPDPGAVRIVVGAVLAAAVIVLALGLLGLAGIAAALAAGVLALATRRR